MPTSTTRGRTARTRSWSAFAPSAGTRGISPRPAEAARRPALRMQRGRRRRRRRRAHGAGLAVAEERLDLVAPAGVTAVGAAAVAILRSCAPRGDPGVAAVALAGAGADHLAPRRPARVDRLGEEGARDVEGPVARAIGRQAV